MRIAVIDLGTNTCNLLVAEINAGNFNILHQSKQLVKLGDNKIKENEISPEATLRTIKSFRIHKQLIKKFNAQKVIVIGTSAIRTAENKVDFLNKINAEFGWKTDVISGEKEAELIFKGVLLAFKSFKQAAVILDIGGGSNELILGKKTELIWKESRPTGMARVINRFEISNPILNSEIKILQNYFSEEHKNAIHICKKEKVQFLVGCSGAFDTIADIIDKVNPGEKQRTTQEITIEDFYKTYDLLVRSKRNERLKITGMDSVRIDLIVPAIILIEQLISEIGIKKIVQTDFALREGVLFNLMQKKNL